MSRFLLGMNVACLLAFGARAEQIVISEVMYNPRGDAPEWIERSNITATPFDIADWRLRGDAELDFPAFDGNRADDAFLSTLHHCDDGWAGDVGDGRRALVAQAERGAAAGRDL